jgi:DNA-binding transcriptional LysR family regulator
MDSLDGIDVFLAVAEHLGFRAAAARLGMAPSAVSEAVRRLEARVGAPLFVRTTRSVALTEAGERLLAHARPAAELLRVGLSQAGDLASEPRGRLRINAPTAAIPILVRTVLPGFLARHPRVRVELDGEDRLVDVVAEGFDAGVRFGHLVAADMVTTRLSPPDRHLVVGSPATIARWGAPSTPAALTAVPCITVRRPTLAPEPWRFVVDGRPTAVHVDGPLSTTDVAACVQGALSGLGFACVAGALVREHVDRGELVPVLEPYAAPLSELVLYYPSRSRALPKLRALVAHLREVSG